MKSVTTRMITPPIVAPTSGIRPKKDISTASGTANGTPRIVRMQNVRMPLIVVIVRAPVT